MNLSKKHKEQTKELTDNICKKSKKVTIFWQSSFLAQLAVPITDQRSTILWKESVYTLHVYDRRGAINIMSDTCVLSSLTLVSSSASVLGGICLLVTHYKIKTLHYGLRNILCFLTISGILTSSGYIAGAINSMIESSGGKYSDVVCKAQSFLTTFSNLASFSWTSMIAVHLYLLVVTPMDWDKKKSLKVVYHIIGWLIPGKIAVIHPFTVTAVLIVCREPK